MMRPRLTALTHGPGSSSLRTPTRSMPSQEDSGSPSTRVKLHFGGRVYRAGDDSSPAAKTLRGVAPDQLLGQPDEFTVDAAYAAADQAALSKSNMVPSLLASPSIHEAPASSSSPTSTKPGASSQPLAQDSDSDLEIGPSSSPFVSPFSSPARARKVPFKSPEKQPQQPGQDSSDVELPVNYQNLLSLHTALERAIMLHISTEGKAGLIASAVAHASQQPNVASTYKVEIPALAPYTALKGVVERGSGLQFGEKQLGQLLWIWQRASDARLKRGDQTARGLGFILSRVPDVSKGFGSKSGTWGVGIELEVKRNEPEPTMELLGASASPRKQAGRSSLGGGGGGARDGMSVVALWSQGSDGRKELVRQTLGQMVLDQLEVSEGALASSTHAQVADRECPVVWCCRIPRPQPVRALWVCRTSRRSSERRQQQGAPPCLPPLLPHSASLRPSTSILMCRRWTLLPLPRSQARRCRRSPSARRPNTGKWTTTCWRLGSRGSRRRPRPRRRRRQAVAINRLPKSGPTVWQSECVHKQCLFCACCEDPGSDTHDRFARRNRIKRPRRRHNRSWTSSRRRGRVSSRTRLRRTGSGSGWLR